ncbi:MAG: dUTPase [Clostridia bacterium]|nr:dUTPase [Clostridia bacterium]
MDDMLRTIFEEQGKLDDYITQKRNLDKGDMSEWVQRILLAMLSEMSELLDEVNYKWWKNPKKIDEDKVKEECVDVLHFFVSLCRTVGLTADEVFERYLAKNQRNFDRQDGKADSPDYKA